MEVDFVIVGHSRSGTGYMAELFTRLGYHVGHEVGGEYGISSWLWAADAASPPWGPSQTGISAKHRIQVVRNPWKVICSSLTAAILDPRVMGYMRYYVKLPTECPPLELAAHMVIEWNKLIQLSQPELVIQVERADKILPSWLRGEGYDPKSYEPIPTNWNTRPESGHFSSQLILTFPQQLQDELNAHAKFYGYSCM